MPYLTADYPGIGGQLKHEPADFFVEEIPLYHPSGQGQHIYLTLEKEGIPTFGAVKRIAQALNISPKTIGYAGLKDAQAITRQTLSIDGVDPKAVASLNLPKIRVLQVARHQNKLKIGHLAGNRFVIKVRGVQADALSPAKTMLDILAEKGVPNFFGEQRFGIRINTHRLGETLVRGNPQEFVAEYLGRPQVDELPPIQEARTLVDEGQWEKALQRWPGHLADERKLLAAIVQAKGQLDPVFKVLDKKLKNFFVSAFQSALFNELLTQRLDTINYIEKGDIAYLHRNGAAFLVTEPIAEQPRVDSFEISPSGPLFGPKLLLAEELPGQREQACLAKHALTLEDFKIPGLKLRGGRRPYRFIIKNTKVDWAAEVLSVSFELPPGAYATVVMAELMKPKP
jgi:tRNA pseudouridine13 synthase